MLTGIGTSTYLYIMVPDTFHTLTSPSTIVHDPSTMTLISGPETHPSTPITEMIGTLTVFGVVMPVAFIAITIAIVELA